MAANPPEKYMPAPAASAHPQPDATGAEVLADLDALWYALEAGPVTGAARVDGRLRVERVRVAVSRLQADHARLVEAARNLMDYIGEREVSHCSVHPPCDEPGDPLRRENYCAWCDRIAALRTALGGGQ